MTKYVTLNMKSSKRETNLSNQENILHNNALNWINDKDSKACRQVGVNLVNIKKNANNNKTLLEAKHSSIVKFKNKAKLNIRKGGIKNKTNHLTIQESIKGNPQYLYDYFNDIYFYLKENEEINTPSYSNISLTQKHISTKQRRKLVEWLFKIHWRFNFLNETLSLAINLLDRYLSSFPVLLRDFQLLGVTVLFIASKYEEIYPPDADQFANLTDNKVKNNDIIKMEYEILKNLQFDILTIPTDYFIIRYHFLSGMNEEVLHLSQFFLKLILLSIHCLNFPSSVKAASALLLSSKILKMESSKYSNKNDNESKDFSSSAIWTNSLKLITGFTVDNLKLCQDEMLQLIKKNYQEANAMIQKYSTKKYLNVSRFFKQKGI